MAKTMVLLAKEILDQADKKLISEYVSEGLHIVWSTKHVEDHIFTEMKSINPGIIDENEISAGLSYFVQNYEKEDNLIIVYHQQLPPLEWAKKQVEQSRQRETMILGNYSASKSYAYRFVNALHSMVVVLFHGKKIAYPGARVRVLPFFIAKRMTEMPPVKDSLVFWEEILLSTGKGTIAESQIEQVSDNDQVQSAAEALKETIIALAIFIKFASVSLISAGIDYSIYSLLFSVMGVEADYSQVGARIVSSVVNFMLNFKVVFKHQENGRSIWAAMAKYYILALCILGISSMSIGILTRDFGLNAYLAKLMTDFVLYCISFIVQREMIFKNKIHEGKDAT